MNIIIRIVFIVMGVLIGFLIYSFVVNPLVLQPLCLTGTDGCVRIGYYNYKNSALVHMKNTGVWVWYNGFKTFVFGQDVGNICQNPTYSPAYAISNQGVKEGYECVVSLDQLIEFYKARSKFNYIYKRVKDRANYGVFDVINELNSKNIISLT